MTWVEMEFRAPRVELRGLVSVAQGLLVVAGVVYSGMVAWSSVLGGRVTDAASLTRAYEWQERLGLDARKTALALAELSPEKEEQYLLKAAQGEHPPVDALVRLSLRAEFGGRREEAIQYMERAVESERKYRVLLAAATQAARLGDEDRLLRRAAEALRYCPRDADDVFGLLVRAPRGAAVLAGARRAQREEYLRFLIGRQEYLAALEYQAELEGSARVEELRRDLAERFVLGKQWAEASRMHGDVRGGVVNGRFEKQPRSLGFDWRLAQGADLAVDWLPGQLRMKVGGQAERRELLSQYVRERSAGVPRVEVDWTGEVAGLRWEVERLHEEWVRVALVAERGGARQFTVRGVQLRAAQ